MKIFAYHQRMRRHFIPEYIHQEGSQGMRRVNKKLLGLFRAVPAIYTCRQQKHSFSADVIIDFSLFHSTQQSTVKAKIKLGHTGNFEHKKSFLMTKVSMGK